MRKADKVPPVLHNETDFRRYITERIKPNAHVSYIESHMTSAGIPDLNIYLRRQDIWLELKTLSDTKDPKMRNTQKRWHVNRFENKGLSWVIALDLDQMVMLVLPGNIAAGLPAKTSVWRATANIHPVLDIVVVLQSMARRVKNAQHQFHRSAAPPSTRKTGPSLPPIGERVERVGGRTDHSGTGVPDAGRAEDRAGIPGVLPRR
jgi:hypothetical protein